jgi:hypothetical protein
MIEFSSNLEHTTLKEKNDFLSFDAWFLFNTHGKSMVKYTKKWVSLDSPCIMHIKLKK